jgi:hypothetical protein
MTKLTVASRNFANAPKNCLFSEQILAMYSLLVSIQLMELKGYVNIHVCSPHHLQ